MVAGFAFSGKSRESEAPAISRILFSFSRAATICLCDQYPGFQRREQRLIPYLVLLREGFAKTERIAPVPGGLLPRLFTLAGSASGGLFSAALSFPGRIVPGIPLCKGLPALRSPDFPPVQKTGGCLLTPQRIIYALFLKFPMQNCFFLNFVFSWVEK